MGPFTPVIAAAAPYVGTAASLIGAYQSYKGGQESAEAAREQYKAEMYDEKNRARAEMAERRARLAASGVQGTGSPAMFLEAAEKQDKKRLNYMKRAGKAKADAYETEGTAGVVGSLAKIPGYWA